MKDITFEQLILDAFDQLSPFYSSEKESSKKISLSSKLCQDYFAIKNQISIDVSTDEKDKQVRVLPPQLTAQALARFMGEANTCWVIEDFHKIDKSERSKLSQVMKVFMDMAGDYKSLKIIAIGAVDTARQVIEYDSEMRHRVAEIEIPLMKKEELKEIITKGGKLLSIEFNDELKSGVSEFSNGMASMCHQLCLNVCTSEEIYETYDIEVVVDEEHLNTALQMYVEQSSDTIKKAFDTAFKQKRTKKYDNSKIIIEAMSKLPQEGGVRAEIYTKIIKSVPDYPQGNMTRFIGRLCREGDSSLLRHDNVSGRYSFKDPIYKAFALAYFSKNKSKNANNNTQIKANDLKEFLNKMKFEINSKGIKVITFNHS